MKAPQFLKSDNISLHIMLIIVTAVVVWGLTCGLWSLSGATETYFAGTAKEMLTTGNFIGAADGDSTAQQAPLALWVFAGIQKISGGVDSLPLRLVSVFFALITLCCTYLCGRKLISPKVGFYSAFILATCPAFMLAAAKVGPDMIFTGLITLSITAVVTHKHNVRVSILRAVIIWLCLVAAFLTHGPLAVFMVLLFIVLFAMAHGREVAYEFKALRFFSGILTGVVIIAVWLFLEYQFTGGTFVKQELQEFKLLITDGIDVANWYYYFTHAGHILGIWAIGLVVAVIMLLIHKAVFIPKWYVWLFWFAPGFVLLCFVHVKNPDFALPLLPPLALFIGYYLSALSDKVMDGRLSGLFAGVIGKIIMLLGIIICTTALILFVQLEFAWDYAFYVGRQGLVIAFVLGLLLIFVGSWRYQTRLGVLLGALIFVMLALNLGLNAVVRPALDVTQSSRYFSQNLQNMYPELQDLGLGVATTPDNLDIAGPRLHVYGAYPTMPLPYSAAMFANDATPGLPDFILMSYADFTGLAVRPELGGFAPVFWDTVEERFNLVLLKRQATTITSPTAPMPLIYTVPKPLVLAAAEAYLPTTTEEEIAPITSPEEDEAALKEIFGGAPAAEQIEAAEAVTPETEAETAVEQAITAPAVEPDSSKTEAAPATDTPEAATIIEETEGTSDAPINASPTESIPTGDDPSLPEPIQAPTPAEPATVPHDINATPEPAMPSTDAAVTSPLEEIIIEAVEQPEPAVVEEPAPANGYGNSGTATSSDADEPQVNPNEAATTTPTTDTTNRETPANTSDAAPPLSRSWRWSPVGTAYAAELPGIMTPAETAGQTEDLTDKQALAAPLPKSALSPQDVVIRELMSPPNTVGGSPMSVVHLNNTKCVLSQGFMLANGELIPYRSNCGGRNAALLDVNTYQPNLVRFFSVNLQNGFQDNAYALHWLKKQAGKFAAEYNMLVINNLPAEPEMTMPYSLNFNRWAMKQLESAVKPKAMFFTGYDPAQVQNIDNILALNDLETVVFDDRIAARMQINFGLTKTVLLMEFNYTEPQFLELPDKPLSQLQTRSRHTAFAVDDDLAIKSHYGAYTYQFTLN